MSREVTSGASGLWPSESIPPPLPPRPGKTTERVEQVRERVIQQATREAASTPPGPPTGNYESWTENQLRWRLYELWEFSRTLSQSAQTSTAPEQLGHVKAELATVQGLIDYESFTKDQLESELYKLLTHQQRLSERSPNDEVFDVRTRLNKVRAIFRLRSTEGEVGQMRLPGEQGRAVWIRAKPSAMEEHGPGKPVPRIFQNLLRRSPMAAPQTVPEPPVEEPMIPRIMVKDMVDLLEKGEFPSTVKHEGKTYLTSFNQRTKTIVVQDAANMANSLHLRIGEGGDILQVTASGQAQADQRAAPSQRVIPAHWMPVMNVLLGITDEKRSSYASSSSVGEVTVLLSVFREGVRNYPREHARKLLAAIAPFRPPVQPVKRSGVSAFIYRSWNDLLGRIVGLQVKALDTPEEVASPCTELFSTLKDVRKEVGELLERQPLSESEIRALTEYYNKLDDVIKIYEGLDLSGKEEGKEKFLEMLQSNGPFDLIADAFYTVRGVFNPAETRATITKVRTKVSYFGQIGVDAGGLSKDYLSELIAGLTSHGDVEFRDNPKLSGARYPVARGDLGIDTEGKVNFPALSDEGKQQCFEIGQLLMYAYSNPYDFALTGRHLEETIFNAALCLTAEEVDTDFAQLSVATKCKMAKAVLEAQQADYPPQSYEQITTGLSCLERMSTGTMLTEKEVITLLPSLSDEIVDFASITSEERDALLRGNAPPEVQDKFTRIYTAHKAGITEGLLAEIFFTPIANRLAPIHAIAQGMKSFAPSSPGQTQDKYWEKLRLEPHGKVSGKIQGTMDPETVAAAVQLHSSLETDEDMRCKTEWLQNWIRKLPPERLKGFLEWATASSGFDGKPIVIKRAENPYPAPYAHTCYSWIEISPGKTAGEGAIDDSTEEGFIHYVESAIENSKGVFTTA